MTPPRGTIVFGGAVDVFTNGVMIGTGFVLNIRLGLLLALGPVPTDIPEGFAAIAGFKAQDVPRRMRILVATFGFPILPGGAIGFVAVRRKL